MTTLVVPPVHPRKLIYLGTPAIAVEPLRALHEAGFEILAVVTQPDKRRGRRAQPTPSPVKEVALDLGLTVAYELDDVIGLGADLAVVVAYGRILSSEVLQQIPMVNIHFSKLPSWRGAAPVERALLAGDTEIGVCLMRLDLELDTGPVYAQEIRPIGATDTAEGLKQELSKLGAEMLVRELSRGLADPVPQIGEPSYANKLTKQDHILDWDSSAVQLDRVVRIGHAHTLFRGKILKIHEVALTDETHLEPGHLQGQQVGTADRNLELISVQPEGKGPMAAKAWLNGAQLQPEEVLGR